MTRLITILKWRLATVKSPITPTNVTIEEMADAIIVRSGFNFAVERVRLTQLQRTVTINDKKRLVGFIELLPRST